MALIGKLRNVSERALRLPVTLRERASFQLRLKESRAGGRKPLILFERAGGLGDIICTLPVIDGLREKFPNSYIVYSTLSTMIPIVRMGECVDDVVAIDSSRYFPKCEPSDFDYVIKPRIPCERWIYEGFGPYADDQHLVDAFAKSADVQLKNRQPKLHIPEDLVRDARAWIAKSVHRGSRVVGIHTGRTWPVREWITEEWGRLVRHLRKENCTILQFGSDTHGAGGEGGCPRIPDAIDCITRFTLNETIAIIAELDLLVGIDSGLLHLAGAVGTPCVGIFGAILPEKRLPVLTPSMGVVSDVPCLGCFHRVPQIHWITGCPNNIICMSKLKEPAVFDACAKLLNERSRSDGLSRQLT